MRSKIVTLAEFPEHIQGYQLVYPPSHEQIMDKICESVPPNYRYISHVVNQDFYLNKDLDPYIPKDHPDLKISRGLLVYTLKIYMELQNTQIKHAKTFSKDQIIEGLRKALEYYASEFKDLDIDICKDDCSGFYKKSGQVARSALNMYNESTTFYD